jgi:flagellar protein FlaG
MRVSTETRVPFSAYQEPQEHAESTKERPVIIQDKMTEVPSVPNVSLEGNKVQIDQERRERERLDETLKALNAMVSERRLQFEKHDQTGRIIVRVVDSTTGEMIREIPPKKILDMVGRMLQGLLVDERA